MALETTVFDASEFLDDPHSQTELLADAFESGDVNYIAHALGIVARARGMTSIAAEAGISRKELYQALSDTSDRKIDKLLAIIGRVAIPQAKVDTANVGRRLAG